MAKKKSNQKWAEDNDIFLRKTSGLSTGTREWAQYHHGNVIQTHITSHLSEWILSKR